LEAKSMITLGQLGDDKAWWTEHKGVTIELQLSLMR